MFDFQSYSFTSFKRLGLWIAVGCVFPLVCLNGWLALKILQYLQPFVSVFTIAALIAFILHYPVQFVEARGVRRRYAVALVFLAAIALIGLLILSLVPSLLRELDTLIKSMPVWFDLLDQKLSMLATWSVSQQFFSASQETAGQLIDDVLEQVNALGGQAISITLLTLGGLSQIALTTVLIFYFLLDGPRIANSLLNLFPERVGQRVRRLLQENFRNYFLGQAMVATLNATALSIAFLLLGVDFALVCGSVVGVLAVIPFADVAAFILLGILLSVQNVWLGLRVVAVAFVIDQVVDQAIAPRLVGQFIGLGPIEVIASLLLGAKLGGIVGLVMAIPLAGFIKSVWNIVQIQPDSLEITLNHEPPPAPSNFPAPEELSSAAKSCSQ